MPATAAIGYDFGLRIEPPRARARGGPHSPRMRKISGACTALERAATATSTTAAGFPQRFTEAIDRAAAMPTAKAIPGIAKLMYRGATSVLALARNSGPSPHNSGT